MEWVWHYTHPLNVHDMIFGTAAMTYALSGMWMRPYILECPLTWYMECHDIYGQCHVTCIITIIHFVTCRCWPGNARHGKNFADHPLVSWVMTVKLIRCLLHPRIWRSKTGWNTIAPALINSVWMIGCVRWKALCSWIFADRMWLSYN